MKREKLKARTQNNNNLMTIATDVMFAQISAKAGIKRFREKAVATIFKEFKQLNNGTMLGKLVFSTVDSKALTSKERWRALKVVNVIKQKRCGKIKGCTCADGSKEKKFLKERERESISSLTVSTEALMTTLVIDVIEKRDVTIFDIP